MCMAKVWLRVLLVDEVYFPSVMFFSATMNRHILPVFFLSFSFFLSI